MVDAQPIRCDLNSFEHSKDIKGISYFVPFDYGT